MLIKFICPDRYTRLVEHYRWERSNNWVQEVPGELVLTLLTQPGEQFVIDERDPLLLAVGREAAEKLVTAGITSPGELAAVSKPRGKKLAEEVGVTGQELLKWIEAAEEMAKEEGTHGGVPLRTPDRGCCGD